MSNRWSWGEIAIGLSIAILTIWGLHKIFTGDDTQRDVGKRLF